MILLKGGFKMFNWRGFKVLILIAILAIGGVAFNGLSQGPQRGGTLIIGIDTDPPGLDPHKSASGHTLGIAELVYSTLLRLDKDGQSLVLDLAESYENVSPTTYIFHLRKGVKFHNGRELVAEDVKYSLERMLDPATASPWRSIWEVIDRIETLDTYTVSLHLKYPFAPLLAYLASPWYSAIVPKEVVQQYGDLQRVMVGTGPFMLEQYTPGEVIVLKVNPNYYEKGLPYLDRIEFRIIPSEMTRLVALGAGIIHYTYSSDPWIEKQVSGIKGITILYPAYPSATIGVWFNQTKPPFNDVRVRRAVSVGIDRHALLDIVMGGRGAISTKIPPSSPFGYRGDGSDLPYYQYNPQLARQLLAEAGYPQGFDTTLEVPSIFPYAVRTAEVMKEQLAQVGIRLDIRQMEYGTALTRCVHTEQDGMCMIRHVWQPDPDPYLYQIYLSTSPINLGKWSDPVVDQLLQEGRSTVDQEKRIQIYRELERHVAEMVYTIVPFAFDYAELVREEVQGYTSIPGGAPPGTRSRYYLKEAWLRSP
jgi:peptide/nickel transport system substrate-binding protein